MKMSWSKVPKWAYNNEGRVKRLPLAKEQGNERSKWRKQYWKVSTQIFYLLLDYLKCLHSAYIGMFGP